MIYLSGCVFYLLLREAAYSGMSARQHKDGIKDDHKNPIFMADLVYTFTGRKTVGVSSDTSKYREGKIEGTVNLPFNERSTIATYDSVIHTRYRDALDRMEEFAAWHLNPNKKEWLIKALLDVTLHDEGILEEDMFSINSNGTFTSKKNMRTQKVFEYQPFLVGILHYILTKRAGKNHLGVPTLNTITAKEKGQERRYIGHLGEELNVSLIFHGETIISSDETASTTAEKHQEDITVNFNQPDISEKDNSVIQEFNSTYYQLIVTSKEDVFDKNIITVSKSRAFLNAPIELRRYLSLTNVYIENILKTYPAIICRENTGYNGETDSAQMAVYGYIRNIVKSGKIIKIAFKPIRSFPQEKLCDKNNAVYFDLNMEDPITSLNISGWSIHKVNLFEAFDEAGILDMPRPNGGKYDRT